jgi:glycerophosphoryl diester phosphodiesterase
MAAARKNEDSLGPRRVRIYAHRGASLEVRENTLPSFRRALELGADALETDAHVTADGVLVLSHDPDGTRVFGVARLIADCTFEEVRGWGVASLEELVSAFPGVPINVDLKRQEPASGAAGRQSRRARHSIDVAALAVETLRRLGAEEQVTVASFQSSTLRRVRALGYRGPTSLGRSEVARLLSLPALAQRGPFACRGRAAQLPVSLAQPWVIARCHALGLRVDYWTVNDEVQAKLVVALGADGIMTDDPRRIVPVVRAFA